MTDVSVHDHATLSRYEARVGTELAGIAAYELSEGLITLIHTEVEDAYEGHGVGGELARYALADARARGLLVLPLCPFIADWIDRHPDYADLVVE